jgi:hypothetical protein
MFWWSQLTTGPTVSAQTTGRHRSNVGTRVLIDIYHSLRLLKLARDSLWPAE